MGSCLTARTAVPIPVMKRHILMTGGLLSALCGATLCAQPSPAATADLARIRGAASAQLWLVIVGDFASEGSRAFQREAWGTIDSMYVRPGRLRVAWVNLPNDASKASRIAAEVAACAGAGSKFWPVHDAFLGEQSRWVGLSDPTKFLQALAEERGGDGVFITDCLQKRQMRAFLQADVARARGAGIRRAPGYIVDNRVVADARSLADLRRAIDAALARR